MEKKDEELLKEVQTIGEKLIKEKVFVLEETFEGMKDPLFEVNEEFEINEELLEVYRNLIDIFKKYIDLKEEYYNIIALWIIGTYFHQDFPSYPYLFLNAMKGSGKTRTLKLITYLSKEGSMLNSLTEAVLFRTKGTLAIDEFEGLNKKGQENLRELLNSAYKKGTKVKRMRKSFGKEGEKQVVEDFDVYRPIVIANIWGMENVLSDRCIQLVLERSNKARVTNLIEIFEYDELIQKTKEILGKICHSDLVKSDSLVQLVYSVVSVGNRGSLSNLYKDWNNYITQYYTYYTDITNNTNNTNYINTTFPFEKVRLLNFSGRELEITFPLILVSWLIGEIETTLKILSQIISERREEDVIESIDISLVEFVSQQLDDNNFYPIPYLLDKFKQHLGGSTEEWINDRWLGRALKRLVITKKKRRLHRGMEVILNVRKAQEDIRKFK